MHENGRLVARLDFAYPDQMIALEADGYRWHGDVVRWQADLARRNVLTRLGWLVLHFTWNDVEKRPRHVAETIRSALASRHLWFESPKNRDITTEDGVRPPGAT